MARWRPSVALATTDLSLLPPAEVSNPPSAPTSEKQSPLAQQRSPQKPPAATAPPTEMLAPIQHQSPAHLPTPPAQTYAHESR